MKKIAMLLVGLMMATLGHAAPLFKEGEHYEVGEGHCLRQT